MHTRLFVGQAFVEGLQHVAHTPTHWRARTHTHVHTHTHTHTHVQIGAHTYIHAEKQENLVSVFLFPHDTNFDILYKNLKIFFAAIRALCTCFQSWSDEG